MKSMLATSLSTASNGRDDDDDSSYPVAVHHGRVGKPVHVQKRTVVGAPRIGKQASSTRTGADSSLSGPVYTVDDAVERIGFGAFQVKRFVLCSLVNGRATLFHTLAMLVTTAGVLVSRAILIFGGEY